MLSADLHCATQQLCVEGNHGRTEPDNDKNTCKNRHSLVAWSGTTQGAIGKGPVRYHAHWA